MDAGTVTLVLLWYCKMIAKIMFREKKESKTGSELPVF